MADERWEQLKRLLRQAVGEQVGRVEFGNLRMEVYDADGTESDNARIAMAFEVPGGSTNQFAVSFEHGEFAMLDSLADQVLRLSDPEQVVAHLRAQVEQIPEYRINRLHHDIDQLIAAGATRQGVLEELNRLLRLGTEFRGGSLTLEELTDACHFTAQRFAGAEA